MPRAPLSSLLVRVTAAAAALLAISTTAQAQFVQNSTGIANPARTVTFSEVAIASGTSITSQFALYGVSFSSNLQLNVQNAATFPGISGNYVGNAFTGQFSIMFAAAQTSAAFGIATNSAITTFSAWLAGTLVTTASGYTTFNDNTRAFAGFTGVTFDEIRVSVANNQSALIDNIQFNSVPVIKDEVITQRALSTVPEPSTFALMGVMLIPAAAMARRRRVAQGV